MAFKHQLGYAEESTVGTFATPTRFQEHLPGESLDEQTTAINSQGMRPGRLYAPGAGRKLVRTDPTGRFAMEVPTTGFGLWLKHALGDVATTNPGTLAYLHTFTPAVTDDLGLTIQKGVERTDGTVVPFSFLGCKISEWTISVNADDFAQAEFSIEGMDVTTSESLATASYSDVGLFTFAEGSIELDDGAIANVRSASITERKSLDLDRRFLGSGLTKAEPKETARREGTGELVAEFDQLATIYNRFKADTSAKLELIFTGAEIETSYDFFLHITLNDVRFGGQLPQIGDEDVPDLTVPFEWIKPAGSDAITIEYQTSDATP